MRSQFRFAIAGLALNLTTPAQAFELPKVQQVYYPEQCLAQYATMDPEELYAGKCYSGDDAPFRVCLRQLSDFKDFAGVTSSSCLQIYQQTVQNPNPAPWKWNSAYTFDQFRENMAYFLVRNEPFFKTLSKLEQAEFEAKAERAASRFD